MTYEEAYEKLQEIIEKYQPKVVLLHELPPEKRVALLKKYREELRCYTE